MKDQENIPMEEDTSVSNKDENEEITIVNAAKNETEKGSFYILLFSLVSKLYFIFFLY